MCQGQLLILATAYTSGLLCAVSVSSRTAQRGIWTTNTQCSDGKYVIGYHTVVDILLVPHVRHIVIVSQGAHILLVVPHKVHIVQCFVLVPPFSVVGGLDTLDKMEKVETDKTDRPVVRSTDKTRPGV